MKTLEYFGPLKAWEIHKWLIKKVGSLKQVEKALNRLIKKGVLIEQKGVFRIKNKRIPKLKNKKRGYLKNSLRILAIIPQIKFIGIINEWVLVVSEDKILKKIVNTDYSIKILNIRDLSLNSNTIDIAQKLLKVQILFQKEKTYQKLLENNEWVFKYFPNWRTNQK